MRSFVKFMTEEYAYWGNKEPVNYAKHLEKTFGKPDEMTNSQLCWFSKFVERKHGNKPPAKEFPRVWIFPDNFSLKA